MCFGYAFHIRLSEFCSVQERYNLATSACCARREVRCVRSLGYAVCNCPLHGVVAVRSGGYVSKAVASAASRLTCCAVHERYHLTACAGRLRREMRCVRSLGYAVCYRPFDGLIAIRAGHRSRPGRVCSLRSARNALHPCRWLCRLRLPTAPHRSSMSLSSHP